MDQDAQRRREAFTRFLHKHKLSRGGLARIVDIPPNIVYNFLKEKSGYLSQPTLEKISQKFGVSIAELTGEGEFVPHPQVHGDLAEDGPDALNGPIHRLRSSSIASPVTLKVSAMLGPQDEWSSVVLQPFDDVRTVSFEIPSAFLGKAFAVLVSPGAMTDLLPAGTVLACVKTGDYGPRLETGDLVLGVLRDEHGRFQTSLQSYVSKGRRSHLTKRKMAKAAETSTAYVHSVVLSYMVGLPAATR